jgi:hypothetical protein
MVIPLKRKALANPIRTLGTVTDVPAEPRLEASAATMMK